MRLAIAAFLLPLLLGGGPITGPSLRLPRAAHAATLLQSGNVLIAGGCTEDSCEFSADGATTEIYDPAENRFEPGSRMTRPHVGHVAVRLPGGDVLIAGGWDGSRPTATAELYEAATGRFVQVGRMRAARGSPVAALLPGGRVLIAGGTAGGALSRSAEIYDRGRARSSRPGGCQRRESPMPRRGSGWEGPGDRRFRPQAGACSPAPSSSTLVRGGSRASPR